MTDNEIIEALIICSTYGESCTNCPAFVKVDGSKCKEVLKGAVEIINRQKAEIERLNRDYSTAVETMSNSIRTSITEAIKEFAEGLKDKLHLNGVAVGSNCAIVEDTDIDNFVKERVGEG